MPFVSLLGWIRVARCVYVLSQRFAAAPAPSKDGCMVCCQPNLPTSCKLDQAVWRKTRPLASVCPLAEPAHAERSQRQMARLRTECARRARKAVARGAGLFRVC